MTQEEPEQKTQTELELEKLRIDARTRRYEARHGLYKVVAGTMVVGIAAAAFPFLQKEAELRYQADIEARKAVVASQRAHREFLGSLGAKGQSPDLNERLALADFYFFLSVDQEQKENWRLFREHLQQEVEKLHEAKARVASEEAKVEPDFVALALAQSELASLKERSLIRTQQSAPEPLEAGAQSFGALVSDLMAEDRGTRHNARLGLADLGPGLLRPAMDVLARPNQPYRITLGLVVAITEMMRENRASRGRLIAELTPEDLAVLARLAGSPDRTIRIYASEFLFDLGDPRVLDIAIDLFSRLSDDNARYNLALVMEGASPYVTPANAPAVREALTALLGRVGPKTDALLKQAIAKLPAEGG